jgi:DNA-binding response OmpR family regulator
VAILILTVRSSISDKLAGFASGADDYLARPFQSAELVARIKAIIRRRYIPDNRPEIRIGHLVVDIARTRALWHGKLLELSPKEYALLEYLALHSNRAVTRQEIMEHVWDENADMFTNTVDVHIRYLRSKLGKGAVLIRTVKGKGYLLCAD